MTDWVRAATPRRWSLRPPPGFIYLQYADRGKSSIILTDDAEQPDINPRLREYRANDILTYRPRS